MSAPAMNQHSQAELLDLAIAAVENGAGDFNVAVLFHRLHHGQVVYDQSQKTWYLWAGHFWVKDEHDRVKLLVQGMIADLFAEAYASIRKQAAQELAGSEDPTANETDRLAHKGEFGRLISLAGKLNTESTRLRGVRAARSALETAVGLPGMSLAGSEWDADPWLLGVQNGVLDLRLNAQVRFRPGQPTDYIRTVAVPEWQGEHAPRQLFEQTIGELFDDEHRADIVNYLQRLAGYGTTGLVGDKALHVFYGPSGDNGKTFFCEIIGDVLGGYAGPVHKSVLMERAQGQADTYTSALRGKRWVWTSETAKRDSFDWSGIKMLTGGDTVTVADKYEKPTTFRPSHKFVIATNNRPRIPQDDHAAWNRVVLVPFTREFKASPDPANRNQFRRDPERRSKLKAEASGVLAWLVEGCLEWQRRGQQLDAPDCLRVQKEQYRHSQDKLGRWFEDECIEGSTFTMGGQSAWTSFQAWCEANGHQAGTSQQFYEELAERQGDRRKRAAKGWIYLGVGLRAEAERGVMPQIAEAAWMADALEAANAGQFDKARRTLARITNPLLRAPVEAAIARLAEAAPIQEALIERAA